MSQSALTSRGFRFSGGPVKSFLRQVRKWTLSDEASLLFVITALAIVLRYLHARALFYSPSSDAWCYTTYAFNIFSDQAPNIVTLTFPPGYPLWLSFLTRVLRIPLVNPVLYAQAVLNGLATLAVYATGKRLYGAAAGFLAGFFYAIYEPFIFTSGWLMTEALIVPVTAIWLLCATTYLLRGSTTYLVLTAILLGVAINVRPNTLFLGIPVAIAILKQEHISPLRRKN